MPADLTMEITEKAETEEDAETGRWISWCKASEKEGGDDILEEIAAAGMVHLRKNPKLPAESKIAYPRNQQVCYVEESWTKKRKTQKRETW